MKRLRHPIRSIREPFGKAGLTVAILALVFAMVGGAWAAVGLNSKQKKEVKTIAKSFQGTGPAGAAGTNGTNGTNGAKGDTGGTGGTGGTGAAGTSVTNTVAPPEPAHCEEGGSKFTVGAGSPTYACNGEEGPQGPAGPSCNESGECLLPVGATEIGTWSYGATTAEFPFANISFNLRLPSAPEFKFVNSLNAPVTGCPGTAAEPKADAGKLCVYASEQVGTNLLTPEENLVSSAGVAFSFEKSGAEAYGFGTWAVKR